MAKQSGIIKLEGTIGDVTFYKGQDGFLAREKGGVDGNRIANDPNFQRTRENGAEFGKAGTAGRLLRTAFRAAIQSASDSRMVSRLTREMLKVIQADATNTRGQRNVLDGELELLQGFDFNLNGKLGTILYAPFTTVIDRVAGTLAVNIPAFVPGNMIAAPNGATHCKIISAGAEIDFEAESYIIDTADSVELVIGPQNQAALTLTNNVTPNSTKPLFLALGLEFYQDVNGVKYPLKTGASNGLQLVKISGL